ncbi:MAG: hypothetical protein MUE44_08430 [Oscillatoriaceae cyanobacterium Prado104]|nr:hypothetical protein [Oscillatoriaceae cyanobacterium Prado104]
MKPKKIPLPSKAKFVSAFIGISLLSLPIQSDITNAQSSPPAMQTGLQFQESKEFNVGAVTTLSVTETDLVDSGKCVGQFYLPSLQTRTRTYEEQVAGKAAFISHSTLPAPGLRVTIRNVTSGLDRDPYPYTDREYDKPPMSEGFKVDFDIQHRGSFLAVRPGNNDFSYEIKRDDTIIEIGTFTARINRQNQSITRNENFSGNISSTANALCQQQLNNFPMQPPYRLNELQIPRDILRKLGH